MIVILELILVGLLLTIAVLMVLGSLKRSWLFESTSKTIKGDSEQEKKDSK